MFGVLRDFPDYEWRFFDALRDTCPEAEWCFAESPLSLEGLGSGLGEGVFFKGWKCIACGFVSLCRSHGLQKF